MKLFAIYYYDNTPSRVGGRFEAYAEAETEDEAIRKVVHPDSYKSLQEGRERDNRFWEGEEITQEEIDSHIHKNREKLKKITARLEKETKVYK